MKLEYGPPGAVGVKHLQYLSADEPSPALKWGTLGLIALLAVAVVPKRNRLKAAAVVIGAGALFGA